MNEIKTYEEMNKQICGLLRLNGDNVSLYAAQRITELEAENAELKARFGKAVVLPFIHKFHIKDIKGNAVTLYQLVYIGDDNSITTEIENSEERAKARLAVLKGGGRE